MSIDVDGDWHDRRLPLFETIRKSYASYFAYFPDVLRAIAPWLIIGPLAVACGFWLQLSWMLEAIAEAQRGGKPGIPAMPLATTLLPHLGYLILNIGLVSIAVAWHRRMIIGERPAPTDIHVVTGRFWRYVGVYLAIALICFLVTAIAAVPVFIGVQAFGKQIPQVLGGIAIFCVAVILVFAVGIMCRLAPLLPARAIDDTTLTFRETWRRTRGNTWRLFWGMAACSVVPVVPLQILIVIVAQSFGVNPTPDSVVAHLVAIVVIPTVFYILIVPIFIGFLSLAYQHFFEQA